MTHYTDIRLSTLLTCQDCNEAVDSIERDVRNVMAGTGVRSDERLLTGAVNKIAAIERRYDRLESKLCRDNIEYAFEVLEADEFLAMHGVTSPTSSDDLTRYTAAVGSFRSLRRAAQEKARTPADAYGVPNNWAAECVALMAEIGKPRYFAAMDTFLTAEGK
ncbi:MAG: hypothetical protein ACI88C_000005 [Acidimicrobiales bacterium]|jgi:hypothetical protein